MKGKIVTLIAAGMIAASIIGGTVGFYAHDLLVDKVDADAEEQYYRGMYDLCRSARLTTVDCLTGVNKARTAKWYDAESDGWRWTP